MKLKDVLTVELVESSITNVILEPASVFSDYFIILRDDDKTNHLSDIAEYLVRQMIFNKFHTYMNCTINHPNPIDWIIDTFSHVMNEIVLNYAIICLNVLRLDDPLINKNVSEIYAIPITSNAQVFSRNTFFNSIEVSKDKINILKYHLDELISSRLVKEIVKGLITIVDLG